MHLLKKTMLTGGLALALSSGSAWAQAPGGAAPQPPAGGQAAGAGGNQAQGLGGAVDRHAGDVPGPIDSLQDVQDTGRMAFKAADTNNDSQISQKEAIDAGNLMIGGFFFRADQNGDGTLSQDEANAARQALFAQQPLLRYVVEKARYQAAQGNPGNAAATNPAGAVGDLMDTNNDKQLQATEVRQVITTAVQGLFAVADTNRDGQMTPTEINAAIIGAARTAAQAAFQQADADRNGSLSRDEFNKSITEPANMVFGIFDGNNDGQISQEESQQARRLIEGQLRNLLVPEPANSARNLLRSGTSPEQVAPVPNVPAPRPGGAR